MNVVIWVLQLFTLYNSNNILNCVSLELETKTKMCDFDVTSTDEIMFIENKKRELNT